MGTNRNIYIKDSTLDKWVILKIKDNRFRNYSHAVEQALKLLKEREEITPPLPFQKEPSK
jgi:hypothetical protein